MSDRVFVRVPAEVATELMESGAFEPAASQDRAIPELVVAAAIVLKDAATVILAAKAGIEAGKYLVGAARRLGARRKLPVSIVLKDLHSGEVTTHSVNEASDDTALIEQLDAAIQIDPPEGSAGSTK